jgi:hypothetical protein
MTMSHTSRNAHATPKAIQTITITGKIGALLMLFIPVCVCVCVCVRERERERERESDVGLACDRWHVCESVCLSVRVLFV